MTRRRSGLLFAALVLLLPLGMGLSAPAEAGAIAKLIAKALMRGGDEVKEVAVGANAARRAAIEAEREAAALGRTASGVRGPMSEVEREGWSQAYDDMLARRPPGRMAADLRAFDTLVALGTRHSQEWNRTVSYSSDLPFLKVKVPPGRGLYDRLLVDFARARLDAVLEAPFDVKSVKVVSLALADDAGASARELAAFRRTIPSAQWDQVGFLAQIRNGGRPDHTAKLALLEPYRGQTVILVGHVPTGETDFFLHTASGPRAIDLQDWMAAAQESGVNLIPIGCDSGKFANFGASGLVNSAKVRRTLRSAILADPKTFADFLKGLTGEDLTLTMNALDTHLFKSGLEVTETATGKHVGRIVIEGARTGARAARPLLTERPAAMLPAQPCFAATSETGFNTCVATARATVAQEEERKMQACRADRLKSLPSEIALAGQADRTAGIWVAAMLAFYGAVAGLLVFLYLVTEQARRREQDIGPSLRHIFSRERIREAGDRLAFSVRHPIAGRGDLIATGLLVGVAALAVVADPKSWLVVALLLVALCVLVAAWEQVKGAVRESSLVSLVLAACLLAWVLSGVGYRLAVSARETARQGLAAARDEIVDAREDHPGAAWRRTCSLVYEQG